MERDFKKLAHAIVEAHNSNIWSTGRQAGNQRKRGRLQGEFLLPQGIRSFSFSLRSSIDCMKPTTL